MSDDEIPFADMSGDAHQNADSGLPKSTSNVVDFTGARSKHKTKTLRLVELLRTFCIRRTPDHVLVSLDAAGAAVPIKSKTFIDQVRKSYFEAHQDSATRNAVEEALNYIGSDAPETDVTPDPSADTSTEPSVSASQLLVELARTKTELFHDNQDAAYATIVQDERHETLKLRSNKFRCWLNREFYKDFGKIPGGQAKSDALSTLEGLAVHDGPRRDVHRRTAEAGNAIFIDLGNDAREMVEVTGDGWRIVTKAPIKFLRPKTLHALPRPVSGGSVDELRTFFNLKDESHFKLLVAWLVAALRPRGPYPILCLQAEHGAGKSTATRFARELVDPNPSPIRSAPREMRDLAIESNSSHVLAYDNLSGLPVWLSDALCRVSTGGGFATRGLFTDDEEIIFDAVRPIILNGIDDIATRADLADRSLLIALSRIPPDERRPEKELIAGFQEAKPRIFGALLTGLSGALAREPSVKLSALPRMADFVIFATAAERAFGWKDGEFYAAYIENQQQAIAASLEANAVASAIMELLDKQFEWSGKATDLLKELGTLVPNELRRSRDWPRAANALTKRIGESLPSLRHLGIEVVRGRTNDRRNITLCRARKVGTDQAPAAAPPPSARAEETGEDDPPPDLTDLTAFADSTPHGGEWKKVAGRWIWTAPSTRNPGAPQPCRPERT
ncbi:hypothetical protein LVJ94_05115 [Pendulispora rubella]|uniref:ATP-binding protein n=1 Tax=Pendulispora rubella TaxID=2741070 RepID=A0ABZ2L6Q0_9BACT